MHNININDEMDYASIVVTLTIVFATAQQRVLDEKIIKETQFKALTHRKMTMSTYNRSHVIRLLLVSTFIVLPPFAYIS